MKNLSLFFIIFLFLQSDVIPQTGSFEFQGHTRYFEVCLPENYHADLPVVFALHGWSQNISVIKNYSRIDEIGDTLGFITVYPQGIINAWNNGIRNNTLGTTDTTVNDVGFLSALIDTIDAEHDIDLSRVYFCGFSMGGEMTYRLAVELGQRIAAIASVAGKLNDISGNIAQPIRPFPIMHFHGTDDNVELYGSGPGNLWSVDETLDFWTDNNGCTLPPDTTAIPDIDTTDGSTVEKVSYRNCLDSTEVIFYKIFNGGHSWPGSVIPLGGITNRDINASAEILNFFSQYENPLVNTAWTRRIEVSPSYIVPQGDTVFIKAFTANPENHPALVYAKLRGSVMSYSDSIMLYDDGLHFDELPDDNIWGNAILFSNLDEDIFLVDVFTNDLTSGTSIKYHWTNKFTTAGPVVLDSIAYFIDGGLYYCRPYITNTGSSTLYNVTGKLSCKDIWLANINPSRWTIDTLPPYVSTSSSGNLIVSLIDSLSPNPVYFNFKAELGIANYPFWKDSLLLVVDVEKEVFPPTEFLLSQNFPNPFNPATNIKYSIPAISHVRIIVYDVLGGEIETLVNEEKPAGNHELTWNAAKLPTGVYFYQLRAGDFIQTKKMMLLK